MTADRLASLLESAGIVLNLSSAPRPIGGGSISNSWRVESSRGPVFLKTGDAKEVDAFGAEDCGLREIEATRTVRVPQVIACTADRHLACLALEWLQLEPGSPAACETLGRELAAMHRHTANAYGWRRNNRIGLTPQHNGELQDWTAFYRDRRLAVQLQLAEQNGYGAELGNSGRQLLERLPALLDGHRPAASLLHGDLWGGNWSVCNRQPVIFDPAVYYGDREADLAMTRLFGGFHSAFYRAYDEAWPLPDGYERRVTLYQLYHVLNHLNLFGSGYLGQAVSMIKSLR